MVNQKLRILNVGCGSDFTVGTDFVDLYPTRKEVKKVDFSKDKLPYPSQTFDEVYMSRVLENVYDPVHLLAECRRVLKKGGKLIVRASNAGFIGWATNAAYGAWDGRSGKEERVYMLYTSNSLKNVLEKAGFRKVNVSYEHRPPLQWSTKLMLTEAMSRVLETLKKRWSPGLYAEAEDCILNNAPDAKR